MNEDELRQNIATLELYKAQLNSLAQQQEYVIISLKDYTQAKETVTRYRENEEGTEILVPVGANSFVYAQIKNPMRVLVGIGAGVSIEKDADAALENIDRDIKEMRTVIESLGSKMSAIETEAVKLSEVIESEYAQMQEEAQSLEVP